MDFPMPLTLLLRICVSSRIIIIFPNITILFLDHPKTEASGASDDDNVTVAEESSGEDSSGEKPKTLERIGFQQEAVPSEPAVARTRKQKPAATAVLPSSSNTSAANTVSAQSLPQQVATAYSNNNTTKPNAQTTTNLTLQQASGNATQPYSTLHANQFPASNSDNATIVQTNDTTTNQQSLFTSMFGVNSNSTVNAAMSSQRAAELKVDFNRF